MNQSIWNVLKKMQSIYNIMIVRDEGQERIFVIDNYSPPTSQFSNLFLVGREITYILASNSLSTVANINEITLNEQQIIVTKIEEIPSMKYRFSNHYRYEIWETI